MDITTKSPFDSINMFMINMFVFINLVPRISWLSGKEEGTILHIKKPKYPGNQVVYLAAA